MKTKSIEIQQSNMYCQKCFNNVIIAISKIQNIEFLDINMADKIIKIIYQDKDLSTKKVQMLINKAIVTEKAS